MNSRPAVIERYWYSIDWEVGALWRLELPVREVEVQRLAWHLDVPVWTDSDGKPYSAAPRQVMSHPQRHEVHYRRILSASLAFPLEVFRNGGKLMILDGIHRLAKARLICRSTLPVRQVPDYAVTGAASEPRAEMQRGSCS
ncbi:MAG: hypothetical protein OXB95_09340 [Rhodobacteraceae bacterium]|nr:hypothetical protein [Paracoccaceae bacterium]